MHPWSSRRALGMLGSILVTATTFKGKVWGEWVTSALSRAGGRAPVLPLQPPEQG